jgi:hypothetical protein
LPANEIDHWLRLITLPFRAYAVCAPVIVFSLFCGLKPAQGRTFGVSVADLGWADLGCLVVLSAMALVAFVINARKMFKLILIYIVIGLVLSSLLIQ